MPSSRLTLADAVGELKPKPEKTDSNLFTYPQAFDQTLQHFTNAPATHTRVVQDASQYCTSQETAYKYIKLSLAFYNDVVNQAQQSFTVALYASGLALIGFFGAAAFLLFTAKDISVAGATIAAIGGAISGLVAGVNFYLYGMTSTQFSAFHARLDRLQRFFMADELCYRLCDDGNAERTALSTLINTIATAPMADTQVYVQPLQPATNTAQPQQTSSQTPPPTNTPGSQQSSSQGQRQTQEGPPSP